jgi:branched-subunit amino acid transport protein
MEAALSNIWLIMLIGGLLTFGIRLSFIYLLEKVKTPDWFKRSLRFVPPAVLTAILLPALVQRNNTLDFSFRNPQLLAGAAAVLVAWRTRNIFLTIAAGMAALLLLQLLFPAL